MPDLAGSSPLVPRVGDALALEICVIGRFVGGAGGGGDRSGDPGRAGQQLDGTVLELADVILIAPRASVGELKPLLRNAIDSAPADQLRAGREALVRLLTAMVADRGK